MLTQPSSAPWIEQSKQAPYFLKTAFIAMGILSLWNPKAHGGSLDEGFFTPERLAEIFPRVSLSTVSEEIKKDLHTKITTDTEFHSLHHIRDYLLAELRSKWIIPTGIEVQIVPFHKSENGEYEYLRIVVTTREGQQNIALLTSEEEKVADILDTMLTNFESHIQKVALTVFKQEMESSEYFHKIKIQKVINAVLQDEFRNYLHECYEYLETTIIQNTNWTADIYVTFRNRVNNETASLLVETDIAIPSPSQTYEPPMMAQNTSGIEE